MAQRLFGTDGVRGLANGDLTAELALDLSVAAARVLADRGEFEGHRPLAVVGRDTRISGQFLEAAVVAGLASAGVDVLLLGVLPTPGVAYLTGSLGADLGVMLSASHNAMPDNGIKFLARGGVKLDDDDRAGDRAPAPRGAGTGRGAADVGRVTPYPTAIEELHRPPHPHHQPRRWPASPWCSTVRTAPPPRPAAARSPMPAPTSSRSTPRPTASTSTTAAGRPIWARCARPSSGTARDVGFALDGDADRCLAVDHEGNDIDGDQILAILAIGLQGVRRTWPRTPWSPP